MEWRSVEVTCQAGLRHVERVNGGPVNFARSLHDLPRKIQHALIISLSIRGLCQLMDTLAITTVFCPFWNPNAHHTNTRTLIG